MARNQIARPGRHVRLARLQEAARRHENLFAELLEAVKSYSLGQISHALCDVGGEYRRNM